MFEYLVCVCEASAADFWGGAEARSSTSLEADNRIVQSRPSQISQVSTETFHWCTALLIALKIFMYFVLVKSDLFTTVYVASKLDVLFGNDCVSCIMVM